MYLFIRYDNLSIVYDYVFMIGYYMVISKHDKCYSNTGILELGDWKKEKSRTNGKQQGGNSLSCHGNTWMLISKLRKMFPSWKITRCLRHHANHHTKEGSQASSSTLRSEKCVYIYISRNLWNIQGQARHEDQAPHMYMEYHEVSRDTSQKSSPTRRKNRNAIEQIYEVPKQARGHSSKFL
jgi:hypothetical protein